MEYIATRLPAIFNKTFKTTLTPQQIDGIHWILAYCDRYRLSDLRQMAYVLATAWHECRYRCIKEIKAKPGTEIWDKYQSKYWASGYYGRGYCQLTWKYNYQKFADLLNLPLVSQPDLVLDPEVSAHILVRGMVDGLFSNYKLSDYFTPTTTNWIGARKIVNGTFKADVVAEAARTIFEIIYAIQINPDVD